MSFENRNLLSFILYAHGYNDGASENSALKAADLVSKGHFRLARKEGLKSAPAFFDMLTHGTVSEQWVAYRNLRKLGIFPYGTTNRQTFFEQGGFDGARSDMMDMAIKSIAPPPASSNPAKLKWKAVPSKLDSLDMRMARLMNLRAADTIAQAKLKAFRAKLYTPYPPIGGKITIQGNEHTEKVLSVENDTEAYIADFANWYKKWSEQSNGQDRFFVHQMTIQGRLPDEFKWAALGLIAASEYSFDWRVNSFQTIWGKVAPMIHDGCARIKNVAPLWTQAQGRTDFLARISWNANNADEYESELENAASNVEAYRSMGLGLHAKLGSAPRLASLPALSLEWERYKHGMFSLFKEYDLGECDDTPWFLPEPRQLMEWRAYGERHEAPYPPIKDQLLKLEEIRIKDPGLAEAARRLIRGTTQRTQQIVARSE